MRRNFTRSWPLALLSVILSLALFVMPALSHHSFAMYDQTKTLTKTGVVTRFVAQANHAELHFYVVGTDGKLEKEKDGKTNVSWGVEMAGAAAVAQQGITAETFGPGTVFSVKLNPLRDGSNFGSRTGAIAKCPHDAATKKPTAVPKAGAHCDSVAGHTLIGGNSF
jgi:hypothetical protein